MGYSESMQLEVGVGKGGLSVTMGEQESAEQVIGPFGNPKMNQHGNSLDWNPDTEIRELMKWDILFLIISQEDFGKDKQRR